MINELKARVKNGVIPAMATPLNDDQTINLQALEQLITFLVDAGVKGLFVGGSTGEGILLNRNQRLALHERSINIVSSQIPVLVHVGSNVLLWHWLRRWQEAEDRMPSPLCSEHRSRAPPHSAWHLPAEPGLSAP